jgi:hypothetical protein
MRPKLIFAGPTLLPAEAAEVADAIWLPPAVQGSIVAAVQQFDPCAMLIIDGGFQSEPAVRHKEILWALSRGIPVIGAASMGALRAAELFPYMQGSGLVYRWYRCFAFAPDDAVAVLHGPGDVKFAPLTHALIDLRMTLRAAERRGLVTRADKARLEQAARSLNFRERTIETMVRRAFRHLDEGASEIFRRELAACFVHQKKRDALQALQLLRNEVFTAPPLARFQLTAAFATDLYRAGMKL